MREQPLMRRLALSFALALALVAPAWAQSFLGTIRGTILDPQGAAVSGAAVLIVDEATGVPRATGSDAQGRYEAANLRPGSYRFQVIASNEDGLWNTTGAQFDLAIAPAWYQTRWFAALAVIAIVAAILFTLRLRVRTRSARGLPTNVRSSR